MNYRNEARRSLDRCEVELDSGDDGRLKYAALELRMSIEALTYDRALAYKDEFPPSEYETWQPRKVMLTLLDIDPNADENSSISIGKQDRYGFPATEMNSLGTEKVLNMSTLRKHYDALGSYLHIQSMKQVRAEKTLNFDQLRMRCKEIADFIKEVLASPVFNITLGCFSMLECMNCGKPIRKRLPRGENKLRAECYECRAVYTLLDNAKEQIEWRPHQTEIECANNNCKHKVVLWEHEINIGAYWNCPDCGGQNEFVVGVSYSTES